MTTRWAVEAAVGASQIAPTGRLLLLSLLTKSTASSAEIPSKHAPSYTDLEALTGLSRSALIEWMKALSNSGWLERVAFEGENKEGFRLSIGDPEVAPAPRSRKGKESPGPRVPAPRAETDLDATYRQAVHPGRATVPLSGTDRTAERYSSVPPGGTNGTALLIKNSPTESSLTTSTLTPPPEPEEDAEGRQPSKKGAKKPKRAEPHREDVDRVCNYLAEWIAHNGSKRPTITEEWRAQARRMIDLDKRPLDEIQRVIRWSQRDIFWRKNILSMPKFREKYDQLRLGAEDDPNNQGRRNGGLGPGTHVPYLDPEDHSVYDRPL